MSTLCSGQHEVAARLGKLTGESVDQVVARLGAAAIPGAAGKLSPRIPQLLATEFAASGIRDGLPYVSLPNGRVFYGLPFRAVARSPAPLASRPAGRADP